MSIVLTSPVRLIYDSRADRLIVGVFIDNESPKPLGAGSEASRSMSQGPDE